jgi:signal transduction histidine kinase
VGAGAPGHPLLRNDTPAGYGESLSSRNWSPTQDERGIICVANPGGILAYDGEPWRLIPAERRTPVCSGAAMSAGVFCPRRARGTAQGPAHGPAVQVSPSTVRFEVAAPRFEGQSETGYRVRLIGFDEAWGEGATGTFKGHTSLPPESYRFEVQARSASVEAVAPTGFDFVVAAPWYRTMWAYVLYAALAAGLIGGLMRWRSVHLKKRTERLERLVASRTAEVEVQARRLEAVNRELVRTNDHLQETIEEKSELLGVAAHDLKNPIFGIRALAEVMLERSSFDEKTERKIDLIRQSAGEALHLINDLLASAANSGRVRLEVEPVDLAALAEWVRHSFEAQADRKDQTLRCDVPDEPCMVEGDERKLREALNNLVSNAIKYSPHGARIELRVRRSDGRYRFAVSDAGPGLSEEDQQRLFTPFQRLTPEPTGDEGSSGLGLYIVKQIATLHDGTVGVESTIGKGSTFTFALPALSDREAGPDAGARPPDRDGLEAGSAASGAEAPETEPGSSSVTHAET